MNDKQVFCLLSPNLSDFHIRKDVVLIPYIMQKHYGYKGLIATYKAEPTPPYFPSLSLYNENINFDYITPSFTKSQPETASIYTTNTNACVKDLTEYLTHNATKIDVLYLYGFYSIYFRPVEIYKKFNPEGIVYLKLDANAQWINNTEVDQDFAKFLRSCDIITSESMVEYLNLKWPVPVHYLPNGFFSFDKSEDHLATVYPYDKKENIILAVGRLGTVQKATEVLLEAFRIASSSIPSWKLVLAGNVDKSFRPYLERFQSDNPDLNKRIIFTGMIQNPTQLYDWYKKAKIFSLPSRYEGFANVLAEAKAHGCYLLLSNIESNRDVVLPYEMRGKLPYRSFPIRDEQNKYGSLFNVDNVEEMAHQLTEACNNETILKEVCYSTQQDTSENFDWITLCGRIDAMIKHNKRKKARSV
ncbi:MAG: glycosyltransferase family 4 protein [Parabacteroides sp.]|nr:glycosyltransferase family 4 protein [Parabacteroides sp.]